VSGVISCDWLIGSCKSPCPDSEQAARTRQIQLTKPPGALGELEHLAIRLAALQYTTQPAVERVYIAVFAADHGVAAAGVSAFPQAVTVEMLRNFAAGGAAINVLATALGAELDVVDVGTVAPPGPLSGVRDQRVAAGTVNFLDGPALTQTEVQLALAVGKASAERAVQSGSQLFIGGEMGIGNTTALAAALLDRSAAELVGAGTGLTAAGITHKTQVVARGLDLHKTHCVDGIAALRYFGGLEMLALAGSFIRCAQLGLPVLVDGFIASVAALAASRCHSGLRPWLLFGHRSAEAGHRLVLKALNARPVLSLGMRLGEGSGAAVAVPVLRLACTLHNGMATFAEAGVSAKR
jgi:nicotinate-nucleotide--dimethylbenzimidazole phosphoribosyltransferase